MQPCTIIHTIPDCSIDCEHGKLSKTEWPCDGKSQTNDSQKITAKNTIKEIAFLINYAHIIHSNHSCLTHGDKCGRK